MISEDVLSFQGYYTVAQTIVESRTVRKLLTLGQPLSVLKENKYGVLPTLVFKGLNFLKITEM